ncbi:MAG: hypothetical protein J3K34DRAFT_403422 [Monoraphidium minutum]|nr:MAG: hypothetical protein J3K34DRAFT_403422 [Monoraphidium minutum]
MRGRRRHPRPRTQALSPPCSRPTRTRHSSGRRLAPHLQGAAAPPFAWQGCAMLDGVAPRPARVAARGVYCTLTPSLPRLSRPHPGPLLRFAPCCHHTPRFTACAPPPRPCSPPSNGCPRAPCAHGRAAAAPRIPHPRFSRLHARGLPQCDGV